VTGMGGVGNRNMWRSVIVSGGVAQRVAFPDPPERGSRQRPVAHAEVGGGTLAYTVGRTEG